MSELARTQNIVWEIVGRCWVREAGDRPQSGQILRELQSHGLISAEYEAVHREEAAQARRDFDKAMRQGQEEPVDLIVAKKILDGIQSQSNEY
jgi:hypothetical protein